MRFCLIAFLLLFSFSCQAQKPIITFSHATFQDVLSTSQHFELWTIGQGKWELKFQPPKGLTINTSNWNGQGFGGGYKSFVLDLMFDLKDSKPGFCTYEMEVELKGAQGVLGLPLQNKDWILALNSCDVVVLRKGEQLQLLASEWFELRDGDEVFLNGKHLHTQENQAVEGVAVASRSTPTNRVWWDLPGELEAGETLQAVLRLEGSFPSGELIVSSESPLSILSQWRLDPGGLLIQGRFQGDDLILTLPPLSSEQHTLTGTFLALLPTAGGQDTKVSAYYKGLQTSASLRITRNWFDFDHDQTLKLRGESELILPSGTRRRVRDETSLKVQTKGLEPVLVLNKLEQPIWLGTPLGETEEVSLPQGSGYKQYFIPVLLYDQGLKWRLVSKSGPVYVDLDQNKQLVHLQFNSVQILGTEEKLELWYEQGQREQMGEWLWWDSYEKWLGMWQRNGWSSSLELPKRNNSDPTWAVGYANKRTLFRVDSTKNIFLNHSTDYFTWGFQLRARSLWIENATKSHRIELKPGVVKLSHQGVNGLRSTLQIQSTEWSLDIQEQGWDAYLNDKGWGFRSKLPSSNGKLQQLTLVSLKANNNLILGEIEKRIGYTITAQCTPYLTTSLGSSIQLNPAEAMFHFDYELGVVYQPAPQLLTQVSWGKSSKWQIKFGFVLPFAAGKI